MEERRCEYFSRFRDIVQKKGGECLSAMEEYKNAHTKLSVKCLNDHIFQVSLNNVKKRWCPKCRINMGELIVNSVLEHLFNVPFNKTRPDWLRNADGNCLELDSFNEKLGLAAEYNGIQHYEKVPYFHKSEDQFNRQKRNDEAKKLICEQRGIILLIIPYDIQHGKIYDFLVKKCTALNLDFNKDDFDLSACYKKFNIKNNLSQIAKNKEGELLDFIDDKALIRCKNNHQFLIKIKYLKRGIWCNMCGREVRPERKDKISDTLKDFFSTEEGREVTLKSHEKRSLTMAKERQNLRNSITFKQCTKCKELKDTSKFSKKNDTKDGFQPYCKDCVKAAKEKTKAHRSAY